MNTNRDGGPAFPTTAYWDEKPYAIVDGMSLRDWFAGQALAGICAGIQDYHPDTICAGATAAYRIADAILKERAK